MSRLFQPLKVGPLELGHRIAMAPLTRYRMDDEHRPTLLSKGTANATVAVSVGAVLTACQQSTTSKERVYRVL